MKEMLHICQYSPLMVKSLQQSSPLKRIYHKASHGFVFGVNYIYILSVFFMY